MPTNKYPPYPPIEEIQEHWLTTAQVAEMKGMSKSAVAYACQHKKFWAIKLRGWRIEPLSARRYIRRKPTE